MTGNNPPTLVEQQASYQATDALKSLLGRIGDIFGVFDFSFFVAGAVCFAALLFGVHVFGCVTWPAAEWSAAHISAAIVTCYVLGIVCFAAGTLRRRIHQPFEALPAHLRNFGLESSYERFLSPAAGKQSCERLYTLLWVEVRQSRELAPSFNLLTRYWVMAAMCDGLGVAWAVWAVVWASWIITLRPEHPAVAIQVLVEVAFVGAAALCWREARRYGKSQVYELVATLAHAHAPSGEARDGDRVQRRKGAKAQREEA